MTKRALFLADVLREAGLQIVTYRGWQTRGRDFTDLRAVVWHHDASARGDSPGVPDYMLRQMAAGKAGAQLWVDRLGAWHILAAGVAFHAGRTLPAMPGNSSSLGVETDHTTGEPWPAVQVSSLRRGTAAILRQLGRDQDALHMHKTICSPVGRKVDPDGLDLPLERMKVRELLRAKPALRTPEPPPAQQEDDMARLISEDGRAQVATDGVRVWQVPNIPIRNALAKSGLYGPLDSNGNPKVWPVPAGTIASMTEAEK